MQIKGNVVQRIVMPGGEPSYRIQRQEHIGLHLSRLTRRGYLDRWTWIYTDAKRAYYEIDPFTADEPLLYDTAMAEAFINGALCVDD